MRNELFDLVGEYKDLYEMLTDETVDEQTVKDTLEAVEGEIEVKAQGIVAICNRLDMEIKACEQQKKEWETRLSVRKNSKERLKEMMKEAMTQMGVDLVMAGEVKIKLENAGGVLPIIYDETKVVPEKYTDITVKTNGDRVRKALESGEKLDFARFGERGKVIRFR